VTPVKMAGQLVEGGMMLVPEASVGPAIRDLYVHDGVLAEGSGAVGIAAVKERLVDLSGPTVIVVSGGNIDPVTLARILSD